MATDKRLIRIAETMGGRLKRNSYTQGSKRKYFFGYPTDGKDGYSDCSSAVRESIRRVLGIEIGSNTVAQVNNNTTLEWIEFANGAKYPSSELMPGDLLYFKGTDKSRPYKVGHVEMVDENTAYLLGHGSGTGPRKIGLKSYCASRYSSGKGLIGVKRVVLPKDGEVEMVSSLGKRLLKIRSPLMRGEDVRELQGLLLQIGYDCDGIDGIYGQDTRGAVKAFQHASRLTEDGEYGQNTHTMLMAALQAGDGEQIEDDEPEVAQKVVVATGGDTWIRMLPSTAGGRCAVLHKWDKLPAMGEDTESWRGVEYNGKQRYVSRKFTDTETKAVGKDD